MSIWIFWKIFGDVCLYFSVISAFPALFPHEFPLLIPAFLMGISGAVSCAAADRGKDVLSRFSLVLALISFLLPETLIEYLLLIPPVVYTAMTVLKGSFGLEYLNFRGYFRKAILLWTVGFGILVLAGVLETMSTPWQNTIDYEDTLRMGIYFAVSGIVLQRQLRMGMAGSRGDRRLNALQSAATIGGTAGTLFGVWGIHKLLITYAQEYMDRLVKFLYDLCTIPISLLGWLFGILFEDFSEFHEAPKLETASTETVEESLVSIPVGEWTDPEPVLPAPQEPRYPWWLAIALLSALMILLLVLHKLYGERRKGSGAASIFRKLDKPETTKPEKKASARGKIRKYYREHLRQEKRKGVSFRTNQTSEDILNHISPTTDRKAAARLREIYLKARYSEHSILTQEDVHRAKEALKRTK